MLNATEQSLTEARPNEIDRDRLADLHYLGNYQRRLPVSITRMMENAHDWEHLPYVHASSFSSIDLIDSGKWGWRAKIGVPPGDDHILLDLLVDNERKYWVSTVYSGPGAGAEIHTQATAVSDREIEIDVRFYMPEAPQDEAAAKMILQYMQAQYHTLYDEDEELMAGRQDALDDQQRWKTAQPGKDEILVAAIAELDPAGVRTVGTDRGRFCVRRWQDRWIAHSAICTHLLGPLDESEINSRGEITCPWHGYRFNVETGANCDGMCGPLASSPELVERDGMLFFRFAD